MRRAVSLIAIRDRALLLVRDDDNITWTLPGGKPDGNEADLECLSREIKEELAVTSLGDISFYKSFTAISPHKGDLITASCYFGNLYEEPKPSSEITACEWVRDFNNRTISNVTRSVIDSLTREGYLG